MTKKSKIITAVAVVAMIMVAIIAFIFAKTEDEKLVEVDKATAYRTLLDFYSYSDTCTYEIAIDSYMESIGVDGNFPGGVEVDDFWIFPFYRIDNLTCSTKKEFDEKMAITIAGDGVTKTQKEYFAEVRKNMKQNIEIMEENISIIDNFYNTYIEKIRVVAADPDQLPEKCEKTPEMKTLEKQYKDAGKKYFALYCEVIHFINKYGVEFTNEEIMIRELQPATDVATVSLKALMKPIVDDRREIETMIEVLEK